MITMTNETGIKESLELLARHKQAIKYRFTDDPEDMVREYEPLWKWQEDKQAYLLMEGFPDKQVILL